LSATPRLAGERAQYIASRAQAKGKITETELQIIQVDKDMVSEVSKDLRETNDKIGEFVERKVTAEDQLRRIDIRAPQDGVVLQSTVHTVGGVITAGDAIMIIVPEADDLSVEAKVNPQASTSCRSARKRCCGCRPSTNAPRRN
jgi:membrane fusion protein, type I secretion system